MSERILIERRKLFEQVASHLEQQILDGHLRPGQSLPPERELQSIYGVGRPAIREALISLQKAGLLEIANGAPARVTMPTARGVVAGLSPAVRQMLSTPDGQKHLQRVRLFFETGLAREAARSATEADIARLGEALAANEAALGDRERFIATDVAFHYVLAALTGNPVFSALHDAMAEWLREQRAATLDRSGQDKALAAHREIFEGVRRKDPDAAEEAMRRHLLQVEQLYWETRPPP